MVDQVGDHGHARPSEKFDVPIALKWDEDPGNTKDVATNYVILQQANEELTCRVWCLSFVHDT